LIENIDAFDVNVPSPVKVCMVKPGLVVTVPPPAATEPA
jgi:hypothetical protein